MKEPEMVYRNGAWFTRNQWEYLQGMFGKSATAALCPEQTDP